MKIYKIQCVKKFKFFQTFWIEYMDELAAEINVKPSLFRMFVSDPCLSIRCFLGPCVPAQYRLRGPGSDPQASTTIRHALSNNVTGTKTRVLRDTHGVHKHNSGKDLNPDLYGSSQTSAVDSYTQVLLLILLCHFICAVFQSIFRWMWI